MESVDYFIVETIINFSLQPPPFCIRFSLNSDFIFHSISFHSRKLLPNVSRLLKKESAQLFLLFLL